MSSEAQRVVVIQDTSRDVSPSAIINVLQSCLLKPGDVLTLLGVLHQVNNPSTLSFMGAGKMLGYKVKMDSNSMFGANQKIIAEEIARKKEEYQNNVEITRISQLCEEENIVFHIEVRSGSPAKLVAVKAAKTFEATWVILDRQMKKDKNYFMEKLACGISRMKRDNNIEELRGPKPRRNMKPPIERSSTDHVTYDEMIPGGSRGFSSRKSLSYQQTGLGKEQGGGTGGEPPWHNHRKSTSFSKSSSSEQLTMNTISSSSLGNTEASGSSFTEAKYSQEEEITTNTERETTGEQSPFSVAENRARGHKEVYNTGSPDEQQKQHINYNDWMGGSPSEVFRNSKCSICQNIRPKIGWKRDFTYAELQAATEGFSPKNFLSEGGFGSVYRGELNGLKIAVKQHKSASFQGEKEFKSEVQVLSKARHENLVMLLGSCSEGTHRLLVYEYVCNGSLDQHLSKHARRPLNWEKRMKIAMGAGKGLLYLHENNIIHRDMRPNNILVTHDHEALLGDFGLARTQHEDSDHSSETRVVGTLGYLAPEYAECGKVSTKTDVYAFGVVLLQMITGLKTTDKILGGKSLVGWARPLLKERNYPCLIDQRIIDSHDVHQLFWMVRAAEKCLSKDPQKRLAMDTVVRALDYIMEKDKICNMRDFSPAQSDSISSMRASSESPDDSESQADDTSFSIDTTSTSSMSGRITASSPMQAKHFFKNIYGYANLDNENKE